MLTTNDILALCCVVVYLLLRKLFVLVRQKYRAKKLVGLRDEELMAYIDDLIERERNRQHIVGISVGIVKNGKVMLRKGYGFAELAGGRAVTDETVFQLASVSKHMVAVCIMSLAEEGRLDLADGVHKYLPDAPAEWEGITIRNLLNLTSGLRRESPAFKWGERQPLTTLIKAIYPYKLAFVPGSKWQYNNMSYFILAAMIEKITGGSFEDYSNHFFAGLGLNATSTTTARQSPDSAQGYLFSKRSRSFKATNTMALRPSGAFSSSISDMLKWDALLFESNILTPTHWQQIYRDTIKIGPFTTKYGSPVGGAMVLGESLAGRFSFGQDLYYGYGWGVTNYKGRTLLTHGGGNLGFTAEYWNFIDDNTSIIILANTYGKNLAKIAERVYEAVENMS